jgi:VWFA-related protein
VDPSPLSAAIVVDDGMGGTALKRLVSVLNVMTSGFSPEEDEMASFRYDHFVWKLSDFTNDPKRIEKSFDELAKIAETRPALGEPGDPAAGGGPEWLRALGATITIGTTGPPSPNPTAADRPKPVPTSRVLHQAIQEAANALKARPESRRKIIFMISDGQVAGPGASRLMDQNIDSLLRSRIQVYSVATDYAIFEGDLSVLTAYARATGGDVFNGGSAKEMETAFARITEQARNQYVLRYTSSNEPRGSGGVFREINVRTRFPGQTVTHRRGYMQYPAR